MNSGTYRTLGELLRSRNERHQPKEGQHQYTSQNHGRFDDASDGNKERKRNAIISLRQSASEKSGPVLQIWGSWKLCSARTRGWNQWGEEGW